MKKFIFEHPLYATIIFISTLIFLLLITIINPDSFEVLLMVGLILTILRGCYKMLVG